MALSYCGCCRVCLFQVFVVRLPSARSKEGCPIKHLCPVLHGAQPNVMHTQGVCVC